MILETILIMSISDYTDVENDEDDIQSPDQSLPIALRKSSRKISKVDYKALYNVEHGTPKRLKNLQGHHNEEIWHDAMKEEIEKCNKTRTWSLVKLPPHKKALDSRLVLTTKRDEAGNVIERKARVIAKGYAQKYGDTYFDVFAPVVFPETIKILLVLASSFKLEVWQFDVRYAFLNGELTEEVYLRQPKPFAQGNLVYLLHKALYGLKQSANVWFRTFRKSLSAVNVSQSAHDPCMFIIKDDSSTCFLIIHVDDILMFSESSTLVTLIEEKMNKHLCVKNMGKVAMFLNIKIFRDRNNNFNMNQSHYISEIANKFLTHNEEPCSYPIEPDYYSTKCEDVLPSNNTFRRIIGSLLYIANYTRPDISAPVSLLSRKCEKPNELDLNEAKRILRYLKHTENYSLKLYKKAENPEFPLCTYTDVDFAESRIDRKSQSGYMSFFWGSLIAWKSRKQTLVATSTADAELIALVAGIKESIWIQKILIELGLKIEVPLLFCDNLSSIQMAKGHASARTKHLDVCYHYTRDLWDKKLIDIKHVVSRDNIADLLTKPLPEEAINRHAKECGLRRMSASQNVTHKINNQVKKN